MSGAMMASAPMAPSTWNQSFSRRAIDSQRREIVDCAGIDGAGGADHEERRQSGDAVLRDRHIERVDIDVMELVGRNDMQRLDAEARKVHRLRDAAVRGSRRIGDEPLVG